MSLLQDTLIIDPVQMNIVNRVAEGCHLDGEFQFKGGLLLQGKLSGQGEIAGKLVIWNTGQLQGQFRVLGDLIVLGQLGAAALADGQLADAATRIECLGTVFVASTGVCTGSLSASRLRLYEGGVMHGPFRTLRHERSLPVLHEPA